METAVYIKHNFLNEIDVQMLRDLVLDEQENFAPTSTMTNASDYRRSSVLSHKRFPYSLFVKFKELIHNLVPEVCDELLHPEFDIDEDGFESQMTQSGHGDFYKTHNDNGSPEVLRRELTYVYYFNFEPKRFHGGELQVFTRDVADHSLEIPDDESMFVAPQHNSIVFFDSRRKHQVLKVLTASGAFVDSRFTINGWVKRK